jgi:hypothetical protein
MRSWKSTKDGKEKNAFLIEPTSNCLHFNSKDFTVFNSHPAGFYFFSFHLFAVVMTGHRDESAGQCLFQLPLFSQSPTPPIFSSSRQNGLVKCQSHICSVITATPSNGCNGPSTIWLPISHPISRLRLSVQKSDRLPLHTASACSGNIKSRPSGYGALPDLREAAEVQDSPRHRAVVYCP